MIFLSPRSCFLQSPQLQTYSKSTKSIMKTRNTLIAAAFASCTVQANEVTWDGGAIPSSWDWGVAANWVDDTPLEINNNSIIHFAGDGMTTGGNSWNNTGNFNSFHQIVFDPGTASFVVQGDPPVLAANGTSRASVTNNSTSSQELQFFRMSLKDTTINAAAGDINFNPRSAETNNEYVYIDPSALGDDDDLRVTGAAGRTVSFNGIIVNGGGSTGRIVQEGANVLKLGRANTFSGGVVITDGVVEAQNNSALGTGTASVQANGWLSLQESTNIANPVTLAGGTLGFHFNNGGSGNYSGPLEITAATTISMTNYYGFGEANGRISGAISGSGDITVNSLDRSGGSQTPGKLFLSALESTHTGNLTIAGPKVFINSTVSSTVFTTSGGQLGGDGFFNGPVSVGASSFLSPGFDDFETDTLSFAGGLTLAAGATYYADIDTDDGSSDELEVSGNLNITGVVLAPSKIGTASPVLPVVYTLATYAGTLTGTFDGRAEDSLVIIAGANYRLNYATNGNSITLTSEPVASPFTTWAATEITAVDPLADASPGGDPDQDGSNNLSEFAFRGDPLSGSDQGLVRLFLSDTSLDGDTDSELLLTLGIREGGAAAFAGVPLELVVDGVAYRIEGGSDLVNFNGAVSEVTPVTTGLPDLSADPDYEYRSFRLDSSNGLSGRGFLRAVVEAP
jgi:fibronectin-binding autotransporter adhesin